VLAGNVAADQADVMVCRLHCAVTRVRIVILAMRDGARWHDDPAVR
jgi:hypothetical protein